MILDKVTPKFIAGALAVILISLFLDGSNPVILIKPAPLILVVGGTICASFAGIMRKDSKTVRGVLRAAFKSPVRDPAEDISKMVHLAEVARRDGLLALEAAASDVDDPFFRKGIEMTVDGTDPDEIREILEGEIAALKARHRAGAKFFTDMGGFSPTLGILGTVIGLVHVLANLSTPKALGPAISSAFTATLWGVLLANIVWLPIANKLKRVSELEVYSKELILEGILAIQEGSSPRMIEAKLQSYIPPKERTNLREKKSA